MSQRPGWRSALLLVGVANLAPLAGWWWNRSGNPVATVELSEREAGVERGGEEETTVWLRLRQADSWAPRSQADWADSASLVAIGFESERVSTGDSVPLSPQRPHRRPAWVLLRVGVGADTAWGSRLEPVAIGTDPEALYRRSGDRASHLVVRGVVRVVREVLPVDSVTGVSPGESWSAGLDLITPTTLHVPRTLVAVLEGLAPAPTSADVPRYLLRVSVGRLHLPRVTEVFPAVP